MRPTPHPIHRLREAVELLESTCSSHLTTIDNLSSLANKYRFERDCARRMYCQEMSAMLKPYRAPESIAEDRGWDCYARVSP